jgi:hypothetical protein
MAEEEQIGPYKFKYENGSFLYVRRLDGKVEKHIEIGPDSSEFGGFLTHCAGHGKTATASPISCLTKGVYLCKVKGDQNDERGLGDLIRHLKRTGTVLSVVPILNGRLQLFDDAYELTSDGPDSVPEAIIANQVPPTTFKPLVGVSAGFGNLADEDGLNAKPLAVFLSHTLRESVKEELKTEEDSELVRLSAWPIERSFVYMDISRFSSDHPVGHQLLIINALIRIANDESFWKGNLSPEQSFTIPAYRDCEASLCIGDGYIFVFKMASYAAFFAAYLADLIERLIANEKLIEFHFRVSVHTGPVYRFWDRLDRGAGRWNYVGEGITEGERVLSVIGKDKDDIIYMSAITRKKIRAERDSTSPYNATAWLQNRGRQEDKHKKFRGVYEINHTDWMEAYGTELDRLPPI